MSAAARSNAGHSELERQLRIQAARAENRRSLRGLDMFRVEDAMPKQFERLLGALDRAEGRPGET